MSYTKSRGGIPSKVLGFFHWLEWGRLTLRCWEPGDPPLTGSFT